MHAIVFYLAILFTIIIDNSQDPGIMMFLLTLKCTQGCGYKQ